jgi:hypothetical protein
VRLKGILQFHPFSSPFVPLLLAFSHIVSVHYYVTGEGDTMQSMTVFHSFRVGQQFVSIPIISVDRIDEQQVFVSKDTSPNDTA